MKNARKTPFIILFIHTNGGERGGFWSQANVGYADETFCARGWLIHRLLALLLQADCQNPICHRIVCRL